MKEWFCAVGGQRFGPVSEDVLRDWLGSGRVGPDDNIWTEGMAQWARPGDVPEIAGAMPGPGASAAAPAPGAPAGPAVAAPPVRQVAPHRGGVILALGIISIVMGCVIDIVCGFIALSMAKRDLPLMTAGHMDPTGKGMTDAGRICAIVGIVMGFVQLAVVLVYLLIFSGIAASARF